MMLALLLDGIKPLAHTDTHTHTMPTNISERQPCRFRIILSASQLNIYIHSPLIRFIFAFAIYARAHHSIVTLRSNIPSNDLFENLYLVLEGHYYKQLTVYNFKAIECKFR